MKKLIAILAVTIAIPTMSFADQVGRYQIALSPSGNYLKLDTKTGKIKLCTINLFNKKADCFNVKERNR